MKNSDLQRVNTQKLQLHQRNTTRGIKGIQKVLSYKLFGYKSRCEDPRFLGQIENLGEIGRGTPPSGGECR